MSWGQGDNNNPHAPEDRPSVGAGLAPHGTSGALRARGNNSHLAPGGRSSVGAGLAPHRASGALRARGNNSHLAPGGRPSVGAGLAPHGTSGALRSRGDNSHLAPEGTSSVGAGLAPHGGIAGDAPCGASPASTTALDVQPFHLLPRHACAWQRRCRPRRRAPVKRVIGRRGLPPSAAPRLRVATAIPAAPPRVSETGYWTSRPSTFCRAMHAHGNVNAGRAAARQ